MPKESEKKFRSEKYRREWEKEPWAKGWLPTSKLNTGRAFCLYFKKELVPGKSELLKHTKTASHVQCSKNVEENRPMEAFTINKEPTVVKAELNVVALIVRKNVSFNFLDSLLETLHGVANDSKAIQDMTCNRTKGTYLLTECLGVYSHETLVAKLNQCKGFSILCDKATDISMNKVFCVNVRFLDGDKMEPTTEFYRLIPVEEGDADGLFNSLQAALEADGLPWTKVTGYASDGENLMQGKNDSVLTRMKGVAPGLFVLKCYCHTFHLIAEHASKALSKTADQLIHDVYNYFKLSPNRQKSYAEFQSFLELDIHKILKPCQTRWLSVAKCVERILEQWPALELFFVAEAAENKSPQADRILLALKSPYVKATLEFCNFVLGDLIGLNLMFQSNGFQLHRLVQEVERVVRMFCKNFQKSVNGESIEKINVEANWIALDKVYPGIMASETLQKMLPHEKESFLMRCRDWYKEAIQQIQGRIDLADPVLRALKDVNHMRILKEEADVTSAGVLAKGLPRLLKNCGIGIQDIDRQWRSLLIDEEIRKGGWENKGIDAFWRGIYLLPEYCDLASFMLEVTALPQSTAEVERKFSKVNGNKTKLRSRLAVQTMEAMLKCSKTFPSTFEVNRRMVNLHGESRRNYMAKYTDDDCRSFQEFNI